MISKFVYVCSILPTTKEVVSELNGLLFKFLWNSVDKVTRLSAINDYERGGLKMIDVDCMIRSLRLQDGYGEYLMTQVLHGRFIFFIC